MSPNQAFIFFSSILIFQLFFQPFFVERVFHIFDKDDNGSISLQEFIDAMHQFAGQSPDDKIKFLFKVYDIDGKFLFLQVVLKTKKCIFIPRYHNLRNIYMINPKLTLFGFHSRFFTFFYIKSMVSKII